MKPILSRPDLNRLARLLEEYEEILQSHAQAKIVSLTERRRIIQERDFYKEQFIARSRKALLG